MKKHTSSAKNIKLNLGSVADAIQQKNIFLRIRIPLPCSPNLILMSVFSRKNEFIIPVLQYRKAKKPTVKLNGLTKKF